MKMKLLNDDVIVVELKNHISKETKELIREDIRKELPDVKILFIDNTVIKDIRKL